MTTCGKALSMALCATAALCHVASAQGEVRLVNDARVTDFGDSAKRQKAREFSKSYKDVGMSKPEPFYDFAVDGVLPLNQTNFGTDINDDTAWVVEFYAPWCGSCETFKPLYKKMAQDPEMSMDGLKYGAVDCGYSKGVCQIYEINQMPTLMFFVGEMPVVYNGRFEEDPVKEFIAQGMDALSQIRKIQKENGLLDEPKAVVEDIAPAEPEKVVHGEEKLWEVGGSMAIEAVAMQDEFERTGTRWPFKIPAAETFILGMIVGCWMPPYLERSYPESSAVTKIGAVISYCSFLVAFVGFAAVISGFDGPQKQFHFQVIGVFMALFSGFLLWCRWTGRLHWLKPTTHEDPFVGEMKKAKKDKKNYMREHLDLDADRDDLTKKEAKKNK